ncbi:unnamed protein product [Fusarium equiseti]|uniref:Uncharacterized protein n=1 Tax=Fusarium equiseti TaxID=61235 RepID=A0A8J2NDX4_FUSEQ|nr:unnamed protein product [Fusarium equiseti]
MSFPTQQLEPYTLYITVSVPEESAERLAHRYDYDMSTIIEVFKEKRSENSKEFVLGATDFDWGVYWHRELGDGTWYIYRYTERGMYQGPPGLWKPRTYHRYDVKQSPRLNHHVVGLVRVMRVPEETGKGVTAFLDWLAPLARMYVAHRLNKVDEGVEDFDANMLILHVLHFAYREV